MMSNNSNSGRRFASATAAVVLAATGLLGAALPAQAAEQGAATWEQGVVLPYPDGLVGQGSASPPFVQCPGGKDAFSSALDLDLVKHDDTGAPIPGVSFSVAWTPGGEGVVRGTHRISLESWEKVRDRSLEQARIDAGTVAVDAAAAYSAASEPFADAVRARDAQAARVTGAQYTLSTAAASLAEAEAADPVKPSIVAFWQAAVADAEAKLAAEQAALGPLEEAVTTTQAVVASARAEQDRTQGVFVAAGQAVADHLMAAGEIDAWTITTGADGTADLTTVGCGRGTLTVTETAVPEGIDPAGIGSTLVVSEKGETVSRDETVFTAASVTTTTPDFKDARPVHTLTVEAVNTREVPPPPTTPTTPPVTTIPPTTPTVTAKPPVVSG